MSGLLSRAEALALAGLASPEGGSFAALGDWVAEDPATPYARLVTGFGLEPPHAELIAFLFAAALSEPVARALTAQGAGGGNGVPLWLVMRLLPGLDLEALAAASPLRRFGLIEVEGNAQRIEARLWLPEAVVDRLLGAPAADPEVVARIAPAPLLPGEPDAAMARELATILSARGQGGLAPVVLAGALEPAAVASALAALGLAPHVLSPELIPDEPMARDRVARFWSRDAALDGCVLIIAAEAHRAGLVADFADRVAGHVVISGEVPAGGFRRTVRMLAAATAGAVDNLARWRRALGPDRSARVGSGLARVAAQFRLAPGEIDAVATQVAPAIDAAAPAEAAGLLWHAAGRLPAGAPVPGVALVEPRYAWGDIVLAAPVEASLRRIESHVRHATTVFDEWGFDALMAGRGRGVTALFSGPSGTGKTMAAEVIASSLDLRMMVLDLSQIISKYVGETSKNIAAAFDQAERSGAVMVWNEGDAIWGPRGSVGNATDRHANAETGDLLQRIEAFRGFTIVTTNLRHAIDPAFLRRFRFTIEFPMPTEGERLRLWRQAFPAAAPLDPVEWSALARLALSGGSIRNVALGSAFLAAAGGRRIDRDLVLAELAEELRKHNLPVPAIDWGRTQ